MPVVAVIGGIASASAGIAAFGAATGLAAVTAGMQIVGGIASVLGAVTGNKKLMKVGMVASLGATAVNGLSSMASGAGAASSASSSAASNSLMGQAPAGDYAAFAAKGAAPQPTLLSNIQDQASKLTTSSVADIASSVAEPAAQAAQSAAQAAPLVAPKPTGTGLLATGAKAPAAAPLAQGSETGVFGKVGQFVNANPEMVKLGVGVLSGFGQAFGEQEKLKAAERMDAEKRKRLDTSITAIRASY